MSQIKSGEGYVLDRSSTVSFVTFEQYADRMDAIARVFPVFFFRVAALVATTTMTRMVDENRLQLGTLKALGYSNAKIAGKMCIRDSRNSYSVSLAAGKPTSISLKPILTSIRKNSSFSSRLMGTIRA